MFLREIISGYEIICLIFYWQTFVCFDYCRIVLVFVCFVFVDTVVYVGVGRHFVLLLAVQCQHFLLVKLHAQWFSDRNPLHFSGSKHNKISWPQTHLQRPTDSLFITFETSMVAHRGQCSK